MPGRQTLSRVGPIFRSGACPAPTSRVAGESLSRPLCLPEAGPLPSAKPAGLGKPPTFCTRVPPLRRSPARWCGPCQTRPGTGLFPERPPGDTGSWPPPIQTGRRGGRLSGTGPPFRTTGGGSWRPDAHPARGPGGDGAAAMPERAGREISRAPAPWEPSEGDRAPRVVLLTCHVQPTHTADTKKSEGPRATRCAARFPEV